MWYLIRYIVVLITLILSIKSQAQHPLNDSLSIKIPEASIPEYLNYIQEELGIAFVYSDVVVPDVRLKLPAGNYSLNQVLDSLLKGQNVELVTKGSTIIISPTQKEKNQGNQVVVEGRVVNRKGKPVSFASIFISNKGVGTISNAEGAFRIILPPQYQEDTIVVGCLGYEQKQLSPSEYQNKKLEVVLKPAAYAIKSVVVRPEDANYLVSTSFKKRSENYSTSGTYMRAFFREWSKQDEDYISLSEALVDIKKTSYLSEINDQVRLIRGRNGTNVEKSELVNLVVEGGLFNGFRLDIVKWGSYFYSEQALNECDYFKQKPIIYNNRHTYVIGFTPKEGIDYPGYEGVLYIDSETLALVRAEFELSKKGIKAARSLLVKKTPRKFRARPEFAKYTVDYRLYKDKWNLYSASSILGIKVKKVRGKDNKGFSCDFTSRSEYVITDYDAPFEKITHNQKVKSDEVLYELINNTDNNYWIDQNIILPEEPLLSTIVKLQKKGNLPSDQPLITKEK